ncbi:MAG: response regulator transcription factor [Hyphomicrobiales bacterium]
MLVLVVEDDEDYAEIISQTLRRESHDVVVAGSANAALRFSSTKQPNLAVLDVSLPDGSGLDVCKRLREDQPSLPVIFLSSLDRSADIVAGLNAGGDDYVTKPFHPSELLARVRAVVRRSDPAAVPDTTLPPRIQAMGLELDVANQAAYLDGINLNLTRLEFEVLCQLAKYPGQVLSHAFLSEQVWGYKNVNDATLLKGHVSSIRQKIRAAGGNEESIHTVHGVGYSFTPV